MNNIKFQEMKRAFPLELIAHDRAELYALRDAFVSEYTLKHIKSLTLEDYAMGNGGRNNFCYRLERELYQIGSIVGPPCTKFGVWWSKRKNCFDFDEKFGTNLDDAFAKIKGLIIKLLEDGNNENLEKIASNPLHMLVKGKILSVYYPNKYLNIFSNNHLNSYLVFYGLGTEHMLNQDAVYKRKALVDFKNRDKDMKHWPIDLFAVFLWDYYPNDSAGRELSLRKQGRKS